MAKGRKKGVPNKATPDERFRKGFSQQGIDDCWEWFKGGNDKGYGTFYPYGKGMYAHRFSYELFYDDTLTSDDVIMHSCDNPKCVNPMHLSKGTHKLNQEDAFAKGRARRALGTDNAFAKLNDDLVREIRMKYETGATTIRKLGQEYGVSYHTIADIKNRVTWKHVE